MCGIAGIVSSSPDSTFQNRLQRMLGALRHRGPDDSGTFSSLHQLEIIPNSVISGANSSSAHLGHARLSILDLSPAGHQPMSLPSGRYTIVFNGEIYNFQELRSQLVEQGIDFKSHSDTEVLIRLYERDGAKCVNRLCGMFAFAIWDQQEHTLFLARDPLGIKPLYYSSSPERFVFASELRALVASGLVAKDLSPEGVYGYFLSGSVPEPWTLLKQAQMLPAGHSAFWKDGKLSISRFWKLPFGQDEPYKLNDSANATTVTRDALLDSIQRHFVSDVPVGIFLSGGIDSTAILALARASGQKELRTFSIGFNEKAFDESDLATRTAQHFKSDHKKLILTADDGRSLFKGYLESLDQPSIDGLNTFSVSKFAHDQNTKVVLSGLGGDEIFGGYPSFHQVPKLAQWGRWTNAISPLRKSAGLILGRLSNKSQHKRLAAFLTSSGGVEDAYQAFRGIFSPLEAMNLTKRFLAGGSAVHLEKDFHLRFGRGEGQGEVFSQKSHPSNVPEQVSRLELERYMRNQLLRDSDVMSMRWGLELRVPFVDRVLIEKISTIAPAIRIQPKKKLLTDAVPEIPEWILNPPKRGFTFPFREWMADDWKPMFAAAEAKAGFPLQTWYQKWSVFVLQHWLNNVLPHHGNT